MRWDPPPPADQRLAPPAARRLPPAAAAILTFLAAASVLVLEIAAGRLLAPYVGVTLQTWTGIIGVILAGIAVGAWAGGRAADRYGPERLLGPTLILGGIAAMSSVPVVGLVGAGVHGNDIPSIAILATAAFFLPAAILSAVGPMIVRASIRRSSRWAVRSSASCLTSGSGSSWVTPGSRSRACRRTASTLSWATPSAAYRSRGTSRRRSSSTRSSAFCGPTAATS